MRLIFLHPILLRRTVPECKRNYRGMVKAPNRLGMNPSTELRTGGYMHWLE